MKKQTEDLTSKWLLCFINFQFFEIEIAHRRIYKYIVMILEAGMFLPSYLFKQNLQAVTEQTLSAFSHYKKSVGLLDLLILSAFSENKTNFQIHKLFAK